MQEDINHDLLPTKILDDNSNRYERIEWVKQQYMELLTNKGTEVSTKDIYNVTNRFFQTKQYDKLASSKLLFETCIVPLRALASKKDFRMNLLKFYAAAMYRYSEQDFDYVATICGMEGLGKSVGALYLANELKSLGMKFEIDEDIFFRSDAVKSKFSNVYHSLSRKDHTVLIFDEGKAFFDNRQSMNTERILALQEITSQRSKNNIIIICVGHLSEIDVYFRNRRCRTMFMIPDRRLMVALMNRNIMGMGDDGFALDYYYWLINQHRSIDYLRYITEMLKLPTQYGYGMTPHIPEDIFNHYKEQKDARNSILDAEMEKRWAKVGKKKKGEIVDDGKGIQTDMNTILKASPARQVDLDHKLSKKGYKQLIKDEEAAVTVFEQQVTNEHNNIETKKKELIETLFKSSDVKEES